ncbi:MAG: hypothetical protein K940chlam8_01059 [Chlamydiae bacterium]|nr:hypothetical protein [Chlamydiota bacterium]
MKWALFLFSFSFIFCEQMEEETDLVEYPARADLGGFYHYQRKASRKQHSFFGELDLFIPLIQSQNSLLFFDLRLEDFQGSPSEGNIGFGVRHIMGDWMGGVYAFYDIKRSEHHNYFNQFTFGLELKTERFTFDGNAYIPFGKTNRFDPHLNRTELQDGVAPFKNIWFIDGREVVFWGFDGEIGYRFFDELSLFFGGFCFFKSHMDSIIGPFGRIHWDYYIRPNVYLGLEVGGSYDSVRKNRFYSGIKLSFLWGGSTDAKPKGLKRRMTEYVRRDYDVVAQGNTDAPLQRLNHPDGSAYTVIVAKNRTELDIATSQNPDIVALDGAAEAGAVSTLNDGQFFTGGVFPFGNQQAIQLSQGGIIENGIVLGKNNTLRDLTFKNASLTNNLTTMPHIGDFLIENVNFENSGHNGIQIVVSDAGEGSNFTIRQNHFDIQGQYAIFIEKQNAGTLAVNCIEENTIEFNPNALDAGAIFIMNGASTGVFQSIQNINLGNIFKNTITVNAIGYPGTYGIVLKNVSDASNKSWQNINNGYISNNLITINNGTLHAGISLVNESSNTNWGTFQKININEIASNFITITDATGVHNILFLNTEVAGAKNIQQTSVDTVSHNTLISDLDSTNFGIFLDNEGSFPQSLAIGSNGGVFENRRRDDNQGIIRLTNNNSVSSFGKIEVKVAYFGQSLQDANDGAQVQKTGDLNGITITP